MRAEVKWVPVSHVARVLGVSRQRVYQLIRSGRLAAVVINGRVLVSVDSVMARVERKLTVH
jgi:excisionase family DNA binding protein